MAKKRKQEKKELENVLPFVTEEKVLAPILIHSIEHVERGGSSPHPGV